MFSGLTLSRYLGDWLKYEPSNGAHVVPLLIVGESVNNTAPPGSVTHRHTRAVAEVGSKIASIMVSVFFSMFSLLAVTKFSIREVFS